MNSTGIDFTKADGIVPAVIQDYQTGEVLMLGYMDDEALQRTRNTGWVWFWSRSKKRLWMKGEESGNKLQVREVYADCDRDTLLIKATLQGTSVCHTGSPTCFYTQLPKEKL